MSAGAWAFRGLVCGYPDCCITVFIERGMTHNFTLGHSFLDDKGKGVGYIMCDACAARPREELIAEINRNRFPDLPPFPTTGPLPYVDL